MNPSGALPATRLARALDRASRLMLHTTIRQSWLDLGWHWLAGLGALILLDAAFALPYWLRWIALVCLVGYPAWTVAGIIRRRSRDRVQEEQTARLIEEGHPELDNALINAVQFQKAVDAADEMKGSLMRREIERGETAATQTPLEDVVSRSGEKRSLRLFMGFASAWVLSAALFSGVFFTVLPRLFAPWMDDLTPPYSLTKIVVSPAGASVLYGGSLVVKVNVTGPIPDSLTLATRTDKSSWRDVPLESAEPGKYAVTLDDLRQDTWFVARGGGARSARYLIKVLMPPVMQKLEATYFYPAYTKRKEATEPVGEAGLHGLRGTKVTLHVAANRQLSGGDLFVDYSDGRKERIPLAVDPKDPMQAAGTMSITGSGKFRLALTGADTQINPDAAHGKIVLEHDQHPTVWFNEPAPEILVTPTMKIPVQVQAEDDIGVQKVGIHRLINNIADNSAKLYDGAPLKQVASQFELDLGDLGARPGDEITYYADAYDNDPGQPNYAQTEAYKIKVLSEQDYQEALKQQRNFEQLSREAKDIKDAIASLAQRQKELADKMERLEKALAKNPNDPALQKQMQAAREEQKQLQQEAQQVAKKLKDYAQSPSASPIEKALKEKVGEVAKQIEATAQGAMQSAQSGNPAQAAQGARKAAQALQQADGTAQNQVAKSIEHIEKIAALYQDVERFKALADRQGQLVLEARQVQNSSPDDAEGRATMQRLAAEQAQIKEALKQLQEDFRRHAADARKDFPKAAATAVKIADEIGRRGIPDLMQSGQGHFSHEEGPPGFEDAQRALQEMQAMMGQCNGSKGECKGELDISLSQSLGKSGLGQSLSQCLGSGNGQGFGAGMGNGMGGMQGSGSGSNGGSAMSNGPMAYVMSTNSLKSGGGSKLQHSQFRMGHPSELSPDSVDVLPSASGKPPKAVDDPSRGYPAEYRKLIKDYFVSVTKEKK
ncbi:MAG: hypothetical protein ACHQ50_00475 [Fimbriimonadales bacterium]